MDSVVSRPESHGGRSVQEKTGIHPIIGSAKKRDELWEPLRRNPEFKKQEWYCPKSPVPAERETHPDRQSPCFNRTQKGRVAGIRIQLARGMGNVFRSARIIGKKRGTTSFKKGETAETVQLTKGKKNKKPSRESDLAGPVGKTRGKRGQTLKGEPKEVPKRGPSTRG